MVNHEELAPASLFTSAPYLIKISVISAEPMEAASKRADPTRLPKPTDIVDIEIPSSQDIANKSRLTACYGNPERIPMTVAPEFPGNVPVRHDVRPSGRPLFPPLVVLQLEFDCSTLYVPRNLGNSVEEVKIGLF